MRHHRLVHLRCAALLLGLAASASFSASARADVEGETLVRKAIHVGEMLNWHGTYALGFPEAGTTVEIRFDVRSIDGQLTTTVDESSIANLEVVTRDRNESTGATPAGSVALSPRASAAVEPADSAQFEVADEELFLQNFAVDVLRTEDMLGRPARVVRVQSRSDLARPSFLLWLDPSSGFPYRVDRRDAEGALSSSVRYLSFEALGSANTAGKIPTATRFESVSDSVDDARAAVRNLRAPQTLPGGFRLGGMQVRKNQGDPAVALRYTDGLTEILLLEADSHPQQAPDPESLPDSMRDRARRIMREYDRQIHANDPDGSRTVARSRSFGSITSVAVRSAELTTMAIGPLSDQAFTRILEPIYP